MRATARVCGFVAVLPVVAAGVVTTAVAPASAQPAGPTVSVEPATDLVDGTAVTVNVSELPAHSSVEALQCAVDGAEGFEHCDFFDWAFEEADGAGNATLTITVDALLTPGFGGEDVDCRASECVIAIMHDGDPAGVAALHFDPTAPLAPPPSLTVTPDEDLTDLQAVEVSGSGLVWSNGAVLAQCAAGPTDIDDCEPDFTFVVTTGGSFTADYPVSAVIDTWNHGPVDCRDPGACVLAVSSSYSTSPAKSAFVPLTFDPDTEVIAGTITIDPDTDLVDGQTVTVTGNGFPPDSGINFFVCAGDPPGETCQYLPDFAFVDGSGVLAPTDVTVWAVVPTETGEIDCRTESCELVASPGSSGSRRAGRAPLHFDADAPLQPGPTLTVEPSTDVPDEAIVTVTGSHFTPDGWAQVAACEAGSGFGNCDPQSEAFVTPDAEGAFTTELSVAAMFTTWDGLPVDCRAASGCVIQAEDGPRSRRVEVPLTFAMPKTPGARYLEPVFDEVEVTHDIVYQDTVDAHGNPAQLTLDVYEPAGDTAAKRPAVVWMHGGWFSEGDKADMAGYAEAFARRGYVAVSMEYRMRPELECCPTRDAVGITEALLDGHEDAMAGLEWLHEHAAEHRIDPEAIAAGGDGAGAANSLGLAFPPGHAEHPGTGHGMVQQAAMEAAEEPLIAAALPISGVSLGAPGKGAPPVLAFHGSEDNTAPAHLTESNCAAAEAAGSRCDVVSYAGAFGDIAMTRQRDIVRRSADFLAEVVLEPLGYFQEPPEQPTTTTAPAGSGGTTTTTHTSPAAAKGGGGLPRTGSDAWPLIWLGLGLVGFGAAAIVARRLVVRHRGTFGAAVVIMVVLGGLVVPHNTAAAEDPPTGGSTTTTTSTTTSTTEATTSTTVAAPAPEDPPPDDPDVTEPEPAVPAPADPPPEDTAPDDDAEDPMPEDPGHEDPGHDDPPAHEFPEEWTPEQVAYATQLIADTEMSLERYANPAILGLLGYTWITDGRDPGGYQHWVNLGWILDGHTLDPEFPESLVLRNTGDGLMVEAAMFILDRYGMENIPDDIAWLPGWHVHDNICWDGSRLVGIAVDGECERGFLLVTPPMVHVWIVDTPCGRFVGIDEHGLMCDHEHEG